MKHQADSATRDAFPDHRGRGRPVTGNAKSNAQRQAEYRAKKAASGLIRRVVWEAAEAGQSVADNENISRETHDDDSDRLIVARQVMVSGLVKMQQQIDELTAALHQEKSRSEFLVSELKAERKRVGGLKGQLAKLKPHN